MPKKKAKAAKAPKKAAGKKGKAGKGGKEAWEGDGYWVDSPAGHEWSDRAQRKWENGIEYWEGAAGGGATRRGSGGGG